MRIKVDELNSSEQRVRSLSQDLESARRKAGETETTIVSEFRSKITIFEQQITTITHENDDLKRKLRDSGDLQRKVADYESKMALMTQ